MLNKGEKLRKELLSWVVLICPWLVLFFGIQISHLAAATDGRESNLVAISNSTINTNGGLSDNSSNVQTINDEDAVPSTTQTDEVSGNVHGSVEHFGNTAGVDGVGVDEGNIGQGADSSDSLGEDAGERVDWVAADEGKGEEEISTNSESSARVSGNSLGHLGVTGISKDGSIKLQPRASKVSSPSREVNRSPAF